MFDKKEDIIEEIDKQINKRSNIRILCECLSFDCNETIEMTVEEALSIMSRDRKSVIITSECPHGPEPTDKLMEVKDGYSLYIDESEKGKML